jgi:hypothetical protein
MTEELERLLMDCLIFICGTAIGFAIAVIAVFFGARQ